MREDILRYIELWENRCYFDGIPEEVPARLSQLNKAPSYKEICSAILKNDYSLKTLGLPQVKSRYYSSFKRIELIERGVISDNQLKLF